MEMFFIRPISEELAKIAVEELNEDPNKVEDDVKYIVDWLKMQPHLRPRTDPQFILSFMRSSKFSMERTKERLDLFYTIRSLSTDIFENWNVKDLELQRIMKIGAYFPLRKTVSPGSPRMGIYRTVPLSTTRDFFNVIKLWYMLSDILMIEDDHMPIAGYVLIIDACDITMDYLTVLSLPIIKQFFTYFQEAFPIRIKGIHFVARNLTIVQAFYSIWKVLMKQKIRERVFFHANYGSLHEKIPKFILPAECGGEDGTLQDHIEHWTKKLHSYEAWFVENENHKNDESRRPGGSKVDVDMYGIDGSFRSLNVD